MKTTLNAIRQHSPCEKRWEKLLRHLNKTSADDAPLSITTILDSNGLVDASWCLRAVSGHDREIRLFAIWAARKVQRLMTDLRSINALAGFERFAHGQITDAARAAADAVWAADAAADAVWAADAAADAVWAADAAADAVWAADAAAEAAGAARAAQEKELRRICAKIDEDEQ